MFAMGDPSQTVGCSSTCEIAGSIMHGCVHEYVCDDLSIAHSLNGLSICVVGFITQVLLH